eukprot:TRINITY_DN224_c0_g1_i2.p1 TRINITY_DN224_c0_g1~~TRINITY_DN224_c0_g1_i2.p1  ORF type:complete len:918 (+),score=144.50 TRINITY_DN224_c0_g1_i2:515-3268(+)
MVPPSVNCPPGQFPSILPLIVGILTTLTSATLAVAGFYKNWYIPELPHLFFGLLILSAVAALLTVPLGMEWAARNGHHREAPEEVNRPHFETPPSQLSPVSVCAALGTTLAAGLPLFLVTTRQAEYGPNMIGTKKPPGYWSYFIKEIYEPTQEVPADLRLLETLFVEIDESSLSGESAPVPKAAAAVQRSGESPDLSGMALAGTVVTRGKATGVVVATGSATESGQVMHLVKKAKEKKTPLQALLKEVAGTLSLLAISLSGGAALVGLLRGQPWQSVLLTGLSLLFATVPEELPILITATLAVSSQALSSRSIFVKRLRAAESLAYVDTILTDKTGTLTHNKLRLETVWTHTDEKHGSAESHITSLVRAWLFMSSIGDRGSPYPPTVESYVGMDESLRANDLDAFDKAVLQAMAENDVTYEVTAVRGRKAVMTSETAHALFREKRNAELVEETPFDSRTKFAARMFELVHPEGSRTRTTFLKGAPEYLLAMCGGREKHPEAAANIERATQAGHRLLGYASRREDDISTFLGFLAFEDPVRVDAPPAVMLCQSAGIRVIVVSGDHVNTVIAVAQAVGICRSDIESGMSAVDGSISGLGDLSGEALRSLVAGNSVFGRTSPTDKLSLLTALQEAGHVVLVTGDGTNDGPILASADIGVAMGRGTDVARASCSVVLMDDAFAGVTLALREGRRMFANLRKALAFYLGAKAGLLTIFGAGAFLSCFPLRPLHIFILELFMDLGASTAFVMEPADSDAMTRAPERARAYFFDREMLTWIATSAGCMAACVLTCYCYGLALLDERSAQTLAFLAWLLGHVLLALNMRTFYQPVLYKGLFSNVGMLIWFAAAFLFASACISLPQIAGLLDLSRLDVSSILVVLASTVVLTSWIEVGKMLTWMRRREDVSDVGDRDGALLHPLLG